MCYTINRIIRKNLAKGENNGKEDISDYKI